MQHTKEPHWTTKHLIQVHIWGLRFHKSLATLSSLKTEIIKSTQVLYHQLQSYSKPQKLTNHKRNIVPPTELKGIISTNV